MTQLGEFLNAPFVKFVLQRTDYCRRQTLLVGYLSVGIDAERLKNRIAFKASEHIGEGRQITQIGRLKSVNVFDSQIAVNHKWQETFPKEDHSGQSARNPPVAILVWMYLSEAMVNPGCDNYRIVVGILSNPFKELVHLGIDMYRRAVFMNCSFRTTWIIRLFFVLPFDEEDLQPISKLVNSRRCFLVPGQYRMQFVDQSFRELSVLRH